MEDDPVHEDEANGKFGENLLFRIQQIGGTVVIKHRGSVFTFDLQTPAYEVIRGLEGKDALDCFFQHSFGRVFHPCCPIEICLHYGVALVTPEFAYEVEEMTPDYLWINLNNEFSFKFSFSLKNISTMEDSSVRNLREFITESREMKRYLSDYNRDKDNFKLYNPYLYEMGSNVAAVADEVPLAEYLESLESVHSDYEIVAIFDANVETEGNAEKVLPEEIVSKKGNKVWLSVYGQYMFNLPLITKKLHFYEVLCALCQSPFVSMFLNASDRASYPSVFYLQGLDFSSSSSFISQEFVCDTDVYSVLHLRTPSFIERTAATAAVSSSFHSTMPLRTAFYQLSKGLRQPVQRVSKFLTDMELDGVCTLGEFYAVVDMGLFNLNADRALSNHFRLMKVWHAFLHMSAIRENLLTERTYMEAFLEAFKPELFDTGEEMQKYLVRLMDKGVYTVEDFMSRVARSSGDSRRSSEPNLFFPLSTQAFGRRSSVVSANLSFQPMKRKSGEKHLSALPLSQGQQLPFEASDPDVKPLIDENKEGIWKDKKEVDINGKPEGFDAQLAEYISHRFHSRRFSEPSAGKNMKEFLKVLESSKRTIAEMKEPPRPVIYPGIQVDRRAEHRMELKRNMKPRELVKRKLNIIFSHARNMLNFSSNTPVFQFLGALACRIRRSTSLTVTFADRLMSSRIYTVGELKGRFNSIDDHTNNELFSDCSLLLLMEMKRYFSTSSKFMNIISKLAAGTGVKSGVIVGIDNVHESVRGWYLYQKLQENDKLSTMTIDEKKTSSKKRSRILKVSLKQVQSSIPKKKTSFDALEKFTLESQSSYDNLRRRFSVSSVLTSTSGSVGSYDGDVEFNIFYHNTNSEFLYLHSNDLVFPALRAAERVYIAQKGAERLIYEPDEAKDQVVFLLCFSLFSEPVNLCVENASKVTLALLLNKISTIIPFSTRMVDEICRDEDENLVDVSQPLIEAIVDVKTINYGGLTVYVDRSEGIVTEGVVFSINYEPTIVTTLPYFMDNESDVEILKRPLGALPFSVLSDIVPLLARGHRLKKKDFMRVLKVAHNILSELPNVIKLEVRKDEGLTILGDTHGQLFDLLKVFEQNGYPSMSNRYLFNGDYVDRGPYGVEILTLLLCFKIANPESVHLLRGNHESMDTARAYGFYNEVMTKYSGDPQIFDQIMKVFVALPICSLINKKIFVVHGGLSRNPNLTINEIQAVNRFHADTDSDELLTSLLWSDPSVGMGLSASPRLVENAVLFGANHTLSFADGNNISLVIRSHEMKDEGFDIIQHGKLVTLFSAPHYVDRDNLGAYIKCELKTKRKESFIRLRFVQFDQLKGIPQFVQENQKRVQQSDCTLL